MRIGAGSALARRCRALQFVVEGVPGFGEQALAFRGELEQRRPPVVGVGEPPAVAVGFDPVYQLAGAARAADRRAV
jgi:hypothetical protein